jgi:hypothetical protein
MNTYWLGIVFSILLPATSMFASVLLLRKALKSTMKHFLSICASGMVFAIGSIWMTKSVGQLIALSPKKAPEKSAAWVFANLTQGPYFLASLLMLAGCCYALIAWQQRHHPQTK